MKNILMTLIALTISFNIFASIPEGRTVVCDMNETFTFVAGGEMFPQPYTVIFEGEELHGQLRPADSNVIDLNNGGMVRVDGDQNNGFIVQFNLGRNMQDIAQVAFGCFLAN